VAGRQGVEPRLSGSEPLVLPLNDLPELGGRGCYTAGNAMVNNPIPASADRPSRRFVRQSAGEDETVLPEVFECPQCQRQFVFELVENTDDRSIYCPQCKRYLGEKDLNFILISEIEELTERLRFERERLEKDEAVYSMSDCDAELKLYGNEVHKVVHILRKAVAELDALKEHYR
jgi:hypothetical protein